MFGFLKREDINVGVDESKATSGAMLLDVRTKDEYRNGHVPGSKNIDVGEIEKVSSLIGDKATPLFVYCLSGARSGRAVSALKGMGYTNVKNIGGINSYNGPVEKGMN
ncbi:rhodanese-like domain-containing protein [Ruminococcaceae bacterium OttesenSCG-928-I18]|nr:rhodanese-like domain-containing protein [Ruminococcaceae bacterium OttesenSCG-928-I18]